MVEEGEQPEEVALRESEEEAGVSVQDLTHCLSVWDSPGGVVERIHLFVGRVDSSQAKGLHGLAEENEDIRVHVVKREQAYQWIDLNMNPRVKLSNYYKSPILIYLRIQAKTY